MQGQGKETVPGRPGGCPGGEQRGGGKGAPRGVPPNLTSAGRVAVTVQETGL